MTSLIDWLIGGSATFVAFTFSTYRIVTRVSGWGPSDT
jgi:hypothetical protein